MGLAVGMVACGARWGTIEFVDEGDVCMGDMDGAIVATISAPDCLSSSCTRNVHGSCEATVDGMRIELTSDISWEETSNRPLKGCNLDCGIATATCTVGELQPGTYTVVLGEQETEVQVPLGEDSCAPL